MAGRVLPERASERSALEDRLFASKCQFTKGCSPWGRAKHWPLKFCAVLPIYTSMKHQMTVDDDPLSPTSPFTETEFAKDLFTGEPVQPELRILWEYVTPGRHTMSGSATLKVPAIDNDIHALGQVYVAVGEVLEGAAQQLWDDEPDGFDYEWTSEVMATEVAELEELKAVGDKNPIGTARYNRFLIREGRADEIRRPNKLGAKTPIRKSKEE